jgi:magnesium-transporting ATPase (P-type)
MLFFARWLCVGVVVFVGDKTEIGKIAARLADGSSTDKKTALTATMERLMYGLFFVGIIFGKCPYTACLRTVLCVL